MWKVKLKMSPTYERVDSDFQVGDRVVRDPKGWIYSNQDCLGDIPQAGTVTFVQVGAFEEKGLNPIGVKWDSGYTNIYRPRHIKKL